MRLTGSSLQGSHHKSVIVEQCKKSNGLIDNYKLFYLLREEVPLHAVLFRRCAPFIDTEASCERTFSAASLQSDASMSDDTLRKRVIIAKNKRWYEPSIEEIQERYKNKYGGFDELKVCRFKIEVLELC